MLLRELHIRKLIDFSKARPYDRHWLIKVDWLGQRLEYELLDEVHKFRYDLNLALIDYALDQKTFDLHFKQANYLQDKLTEFRLPWIKIGDSNPQQLLKTAAADWAKAFGNPDDPEVAEKIRLTVEHLRKQAA